MANKRVLVVDDSCLYQRLLSDVINAHENLDVVGVAANGKVALEMVSSTRPDLITLDILMPEMDGIQTLIELRKSWPEVKTLMVSSLTSEGSDAALDALALGAGEYATKPASGGGIGTIRGDLTADVIPKIESLCGLQMHEFKAGKEHRTKPSVQKAPQAAAKIGSLQSRPRQSDSRQNAVDLLAIGVSTGGPDALAKLLSTLPASIGVPVLIVQHMPAQFTTKLAKRLNMAGELNVVEAQMGDKLRAGTVYIAPGNFHMVVDRVGVDVVINLNQEEPEHSCRPSVDPLFRSVAKVYGARCLGLIMTGMGADGLNGCQALSSAGCPIIVQDKLTSVVWGMPKLVAMAGLALEQVPLDELSDAICRYIKGPVVPKGRAAAIPQADKQSAVLGGRS